MAEQLDVELNASIPPTALEIYRRIQDELTAADICREWALTMGVMIGQLCRKVGPHRADELLSAWVSALVVSGGSLTVSGG